MTKIVGSIVDVAEGGVDGTITIWSGYRPGQSHLIAPKRRTWNVRGGELPNNVEAVPGPATIEIDMGSDAFTQFSTVVPDQTAAILIRDLFEFQYEWEPFVIEDVARERVAAERAAESASEDAGRAKVARTGAEEARDDAQQARTDTRAARDTAQAHRNVALEQANKATQEREAAAGHAQASSTASSVSQKARDDAKQARVGAEEARDEAARQAAAAGEDADRAQEYAEQFDLDVVEDAGDPEAPVEVEVVRDGPAYQVTLRNVKGRRGQRGEPGEVTEAQLEAAVSSLVGQAPETLDTLEEISQALGADPNFSTTVMEAVGLRLKRSEFEGHRHTIDDVDGLDGALADASRLTGDVTSAVDVTNAVTNPTGQGTPETIGQTFLGIAEDYLELWNDLAGKAPLEHTHNGSEIQGGALSSTVDLADAAVTFTHPTYGQLSPPLSEFVAGVVAENIALRQDVDNAEKKAWRGTRAQFDALASRDPDRTYYVIG